MQKLDTRIFDLVNWARNLPLTNDTLEELKNKCNLLPEGDLVYARLSSSAFDALEQHNSNKHILALPAPTRGDKMLNYRTYLDSCTCQAEYGELSESVLSSFGYNVNFI